MGLVQSGALADLAFYAKVERGLLAAMPVQLFFRFRDDVFVVCENRDKAESFVKEFKKRAAPVWDLTLEQISDFGVTMLDAWIFKGIRYRNTKVLDHAPFTKPTARHVPLAPSSAHPKAVHVSWPRGELKRVRRL